MLFFSSVRPFLKIEEGLPEIGFIIGEPLRFRDENKGAKPFRGAEQRQPDLFGRRRPGKQIEEDGQGDLDQGMDRGRDFPPVVKLEEHHLPADIDGGADVFAAVDPVPGGSDDLRHVGPHGIETGSRKGTAVPAPDTGMRPVSA